MRALIRSHPLGAFFVLAYVLTWSAWLPIPIAGEIVRPGAWPTHFPGLLGPGIAAVIVTAACDGVHGLRALGKSLTRIRNGRWLALAALSPFALYAIAAGVLAVRGAAVPSMADFGRYPGLPAMPAIAVFALVMLVNGFGEETGWRGFALPRLCKHHTPLGATLILAPLWAGWHLPMFWMNATMRGMAGIGMIGFLFGITCGALVLTWLYFHSGRSVLATALWHASYNMVSATAAAAPVAAIVTVGVVAAAIAVVVADRRRMVPV